MQASRAALESYRKVINEQIASALALLDEFEPYASGTGELPRTALKFGEAFRGVAAAETSGDGEDEANAYLFALIEDVALMDVCDATVLEAYRQATVPGTDLEQSLARVRAAVCEPFGTGTPSECHDAFQKAAYGASSIARSFREVCHA